MDKDQKGYLTKQDLMRVLSTVPIDDTQSLQHYGNGSVNSSANNSTGPQRHPSISQHSGSQHKNSSTYSSSGLTANTRNSLYSANSNTFDDGNKAVQEAIRLQRIQEKVEHILKVADMNRDGVIR